MYFAPEEAAPAAALSVVFTVRYIYKVIPTADKQHNTKLSFLTFMHG